MAATESFPCRILAWDEVSRWATAVARKVRSSGFEPDVVVGLTRGGWVTARLLCDLLGIKQLFAVKVEHWGVTAQPDGKARLIQGLSADISGAKVLLVDDITDTGESLILAREHLKESRPAEVRSATLLHITHSKFVPDFFEIEVPKAQWTWFIFPWNLHEDLRTIVPKALAAGPATMHEIREALRSRFQLQLDSEVIRGTLLELEESRAVVRDGDRWRTLATGT